MRVEEVAITAEYAAAIGGFVLDAIVSRALHETAECLYETSLRLPGFRLGKRRQRHDADAYKPCDDKLVLKHFIAPLFYLDAGSLLLLPVFVL